MCYADRGSLPWSVRWWQGQFECLCQRSTSSAGKNGPVCVLNRVYQNNAVSAPKLANVLLHFVSDWAWPGISSIYIILLFLLFWSLIGFTRLLIILSSQNYCDIFIYSVLLPHKHFDPWNVEHYLFWNVGHLLLLSLPLS